jgi:hypothetical protein
MESSSSSGCTAPAQRSTEITLKLHTATVLVFVHHWLFQHHDIPVHDERYDCTASEIQIFQSSCYDIINDIYSIIHESQS